MEKIAIYPGTFDPITNGHVDVSVHCTFEQSAPIRDVHDASDYISRQVKATLPEVDRVIVHA